VENAGLEIAGTGKLKDAYEWVAMSELKNAIGIVDRM